MLIGTVTAVGRPPRIEAPSECTTVFTGAVFDELRVRGRLIGIGDVTVTVAVATVMPEPTTGWLVGAEAVGLFGVG